jgi:hypothetical protein
VGALLGLFGSYLLWLLLFYSRNHARYLFESTFCNMLNLETNQENLYPNSVPNIVELN